MGYSLRSWNYRFTLWLGFNPNTFQVVESHTFLRCSWVCVGYVEDLFKLIFLIQVNVTDVHAGELYMMADDPGEDHNVYELISDNVLTKMANLTNVSGF